MLDRVARSARQLLCQDDLLNAHVTLLVLVEQVGIHLLASDVCYRRFIVWLPEYLLGPLYRTLEL